MPAARSRVAVLFFTVLIDLIGFGIIIPILPYYAQRLGADGLGLGALLGVFSAMQFLATAFLGRTSDRVGRRPILLTTMLVNALGYLLFAAAHAYPVLPESLEAEHRSERALWDFSHIGDALRNPRLAPLMIAWALAPFAFSGYTVAIPLWANVTFGWREQQLGWFFTVIGVTAAIVQGYGFGKLAHRFGDRRLLIVGGFGMAATIALVPALHSSAALYAWTAALAFSNSIFGPAATGLVSVFADPTEQGTVLGAAQALAALGRLLGPLVMGAVYDASRPAAFLVAGAVMALGGAATLRVPKAVDGETARQTARRLDAQRR